MGANMKYIILVLIAILVSAPTLSRAADTPATPPTKVDKITDPVWGEITLKLENDGEPVFNPTALTVTLLCKDQRKKVNEVKPTPEVLVNAERICEYKGHTYDAKTKVLTLFYSTSEPAEGEAECNASWEPTFEFKELCDEWRPN